MYDFTSFDVNIEKIHIKVDEYLEIPDDRLFNRKFYEVYI